MKKRSEADLNRTWGWGDGPQDQRSLFCNFDHSRSIARTFRLMGPERIPADEGLVAINASRHKLSKIGEFACLNCASPIRLLHRQYAEKMLNFVSSNQIQLYPTTVFAKDGQSADYVVIVPLHEVRGTDVQRSKITHWIEENEVALEYSALEFEENCLGHLHIARDTVSSIVLLSEALRQEILGWGKIKGLFILPGSELNTWPHSK